MKLSFISFLATTAIWSGSAKAGDVKPDQVPDPDRPSEASRAGHCDQYKIFKAGDKINTIVSEFGLTLPDLKELNPQFDWKGPLEVGTPLCVVGTSPLPTNRKLVSASKKGKRPKGLVAYTTSAIDTCLGIMKRANVDMATFIELNPKLECVRLEQAATVIYLPKGTVVSENENPSWPPKAANQDCLIGSWSEWSECGPDSTETRFRTTYQEATGIGIPCPDAVEVRSCTSNEVAEDPGGRRLGNEVAKPPEGRRLGHYYCPQGYDGCSVPNGVQYYHLFVPACNVHDICYSCNNHPNYYWKPSKQWCDFTFFSKMNGQCNWKWSAWWQGFDKSWCQTMRDVYMIGVTGWGSDNYDIRPGSKPNYAADGCYWWPWESQLNNANGAGFLPNNGCDCYGTSCQYW